MINWSNPTDKVSRHFTVKECLWLPKWNRLANESDGLNDTIKQNLVVLCNKMDEIREFLGLPINTHVTFRPEAYNVLVGGAPGSAHKVGLAMDWDCGENCDSTRAKLIPKLQDFNIRLEDNPGSSWVHTDLFPPRPNRAFKV